MNKSEIIICSKRDDEAQSNYDMKNSHRLQTNAQDGVGVCIEG